MASVRLEQVIVDAGSTRILNGVELDIADGEVFALLGSSGSGKTSIIRAIAGLDNVTSGRILLDDDDVVELQPAERDVAMVFQENTLFPHMNARRNTGFPLSVRKLPKEEIEKRVDAESRSLGLEGVLERWPRQLSEGYQQLVQIARAMVRTPRVFLLDEPLARLDAGSRQRVLRELQTLQQGYGVTMIYATNDPREAMALADRIGVVDEGQMVQVASPLDLHQEPRTKAIAVLTGEIGIIDAEVEADTTGFWVAADGLRLRAWPPVLANYVGLPVQIGVRPRQVELVDTGPITATLGRSVFFGDDTGRNLMIGDARIASHEGAALDAGEVVKADFKRWHVFDLVGDRVCTIG